MEFINKHIVIVGPAHPLRGGLSTYNERLAKELSQHNKVTLLTFSLQYPSFLFPGQSQFSTDPQPQDLSIDVALNSINPLNWINVGLKYKKLKPDVIIFRWWMPFFGPCFGTFARIVKQNKHTQVIAITDNIYPHEKRIIDKPFSKYFLPILDGAVAMSQKVQNDLIEYPGVKDIPSLYHPHALYDNFGKASSKEEACEHLNLDPELTYLLFFGFIRHYKGLDILLEAAAKIHDMKEVRILVAGEFYEDRSTYDQIIQEHHLEDKVIMHTEFIPNNEVKYYFSACDVVIQPYRSATQSGVSQIAYHFNKPMIVTDVGGLTELVPHGETGLIGQPNPDCMVHQIREIFKPGVLQRMSENMKSFKEKFSWPSMVKSLESATK